MSRKVTSIRIDEDLLRSAFAHGINISKITERALRTEIMSIQLVEWEISPKGVAGFSKKTRILMADGKWKSIQKIKIGDEVVSFNPAIHRRQSAKVIDCGPLTSEKVMLRSITIQNDPLGTKLELLPDTEVYVLNERSSSGDWTRVEDLIIGQNIPVSSSKSWGGSNEIKLITQDFIEDIFYKIECYPNNAVIVNSNIRRKKNYLEDYPPSVWGYSVKGYPGQIGSLM